MPRLSPRARLEIRRARFPFVVVVVLGICAVVVLALLVGQQTFKRPWADYAEVRVAFDDVKGVVPGQQEVRVAGVKVGVIDRSELVDGRPVLTLAIERRYAPVHRDATFRLRPRTPLQDMYVEMTRGSARAGDLRDGELVRDRRRIVTPVDVANVLQSLDGDTRQRLERLLVELGRGMADGGRSLRQAFTDAAPFLQNARDVAAAFAQREGLTRRLVRESGLLTSEIARSDTALTTLVQRGSSALSTLGRQDDALRASLAEMPGTVERVRTALAALGTAQDDLDPALAALRPATRSVRPALDAVDRLSGDLRPAVRALRPTVSALRPLAGELPPAARLLEQLPEPLRPQLDDVERTLDLLEPCEESVRRFFAWTISVLKIGDGYGAIPRGELSVGPDTIPGQLAGSTIHPKPTCNAGVK